MMNKLKLNIFQQGFASKAIVLGTYFTTLFLAIYILDIMDQGIILQTLQKAVEQEIITKEIYVKLKYYIDTRDSIVITPLLFWGAICTGIILFFMRRVASYNIAWPVTLPDAIEFRPAMKKLGILSPSDEIAFITKHKIQIFIAIKPFLKEEGQGIRARLYPFARHDILMMHSVFEKAIGARKLCITRQAYEYLLNESQKVVSIKESSSIMEKDKEIEVCNTKIMHLSKENENLRNENTLLEAENTNFKNKQKTEVGREKRQIKRMCKERIQWFVINTVLERLINEASINTIYTEQEIRDALAKEWEQSFELQAQMEKLTGKRDFDISDALMGTVKDLFADAGHFSKKGGRPTKKEKPT